MGDNTDVLSRETKTIKENQIEMIEEKMLRLYIKNFLDRLNNRMEMTKDGVSKPEDRAIELIQSKESRVKI